MLKEQYYYAKMVEKFHMDDGFSLKITIMDEYKKLQITSERSGKKYNVVVLVKDHAQKRLAERSTVAGSKEEINNCIERAARRIIDDYPEILPGEYVIKSKSTNLKFPLKVYEPENDTLRMSIPTVLKMDMGKTRQQYKPSYTFEDFYFCLNGKEIIIE